VPNEPSDSVNCRNFFSRLLTIKFLRVTSLRALFSHLLSVSSLIDAKDICLQGIAIYFYRINL